MHLVHSLLDGQNSPSWLEKNSPDEEIKSSSERFILSFSSNPNRILSLPPASGSACRRRRVSFFRPRFRICFVVPSLLYRLVVGPGLTSLQMLERLSTAVEFWLVLESRHGGTELLCAVESAFQGCGSQSFVISVLGGGKWRHDPWLGCGGVLLVLRGVNWSD
ncbi:hypothetical protein F2Q70_00011163 [Brassica cretica]|uniref:Uncharacterized protein n=1 Tax=Brassica cretica TaxID=69181 RepID=A0A8S9JIY6_BRACR|nr:hypothetical protein F2Q68_00004277 [Brassica cretica]KAF2610950.1 hypothetical protein F2Q70_00011163 [Brassica cretica]